MATALIPDGLWDLIEPLLSRRNLSREVDTD